MEIGNQGALESSSPVLMLKHSVEASPWPGLAGEGEEKSALNNHCLP